MASEEFSSPHVDFLLDNAASDRATLLWTVYSVHSRDI